MLHTDFQLQDRPRSTTLQNAAFIEVKIVTLAPFGHYISIFLLTMVVKKFGPFHSYIRPWIGANNQDFFGRRPTPFNGNHSASAQ